MDRFRPKRSHSSQDLGATVVFSLPAFRTKIFLTAGRTFSNKRVKPENRNRHHSTGYEQRLYFGKSLFPTFLDKRPSIGTAHWAITCNSFSYEACIKAPAFDFAAITRTEHLNIVRNTIRRSAIPHTLSFGLAGSFFT